MFFLINNILSCGKYSGILAATDAKPQTVIGNFRKIEKYEKLTINLNMNDLITIIIIGIYTLIYVIVFLLQKNQIQKQAGIIASMESFMKIFDVEQVRKFVEMKHETTMLSIDKIVAEKGKEFSEQTVKPYVFSEISKLKGEMADRFDEFGSAIIDIILQLPKEMRKEYVETVFPLNQKVLLEIVDEIEKRQESES